MKLSALSIEQFCDETASDKAVPGGGSVAALSAGLAVSLLEMVGQMTARKAAKAGEELKPEISKAIMSANTARSKFLELIDTDAAAFDTVMAAFAMPKTTDEEKKLRSEKIQASYKNAVLPPLTVVRMCNNLIPHIKTMLEKGDTNALSDSCVSAHMLVSAIWGGIYNVRINLSAIKDAEFVADKTNEIQLLEAEAIKFAGQIPAHAKF